MKKIMLFSMALCGVFMMNDCFADADSVCSNPVTCGQYNIGGAEESKLCENKNVGDDCTEGKIGATRAVCFQNSNNTISCAARECKGDYLLWLTNARGSAPQSQGRCISRQYLIDFCKKGCGGCKDDEKCVVNETVFKVTDRPYNTPAFVGEEACKCVADPKPVVEEKPTEEDCPDGGCVYTLNVNITCADGWKFEQNKEIKLTKKQAADFKAKEAKEKLQVDVDIKNLTDEYKEYKELLEYVCKDHMKNVSGSSGTSGETVTSQKVTEARDTLSAFYKLAESDRDGWKNAEGNFNTARLVSDLTAGVVLGTVGGVVSSKIIKKKQIEKGFDVLHCSVGGQTVADWGDEFVVGLSR